MVIRPKSMATVVVRLPGTAATSSTPIDAVVIALLGEQRRDLRERLHQGRLADPEAAGDDDLQGNRSSISAHGGPPAAESAFSGVGPPSGLAAGGSCTTR